MKGPQARWVVQGLLKVPETQLGVRFQESGTLLVGWFQALETLLVGRFQEPETLLVGRFQEPETLLVERFQEPGTLLVGRFQEPETPLVVWYRELEAPWATVCNCRLVEVRPARLRYSWTKHCLKVGTAIISGLTVGELGAASS
jgi:hypothetical protein